MNLLFNYINKGHERSIKAKQNIAYSFLMKGLSIVIGFVIVPLTINYVNPTKYGIWLTLSSVITWFALFDIGLTGGLRNKLTESLAEGNKKLARIYISTTYAVMCFIIFPVLLIFICVQPFLNWAKILNAPADLQRELNLLVIFVFIFFCLQFVFKVITTVLIADQKPAKATFINLLGSLFSVITIYILTKTTEGSLLYLGLALSICPLSVLIVSSLWFYKSEYKEFAPSFKYVKFGYLKNIASLGVQFFLIQIVSIIIYSSSNMLISQFFGPAEVTPYNVAYKLFTASTMFFTIIIAPFPAAFTDAFHKKDIQWIKNSVKNLIKVWLGFSILVFITFLFSPLIFKFWLGDKVYVSMMLSFNMAIFVILNNFCMIFGTFINGTGKIRLQVYVAFVEAIVFIPSAYLLAKVFNLNILGVVIANSIPQFAGAIWLPIQYYKLINNKAHGIWAK